MMLSPILIKYNGKITKKVMAGTYNQDRQAQENMIAADSIHLDGHVLICGFGRVGQTLARFLKKAGVPYIALDMDIARVTEAKRAGELVYYGDSSRKEILQAAGIDRAKLIVLSISDFHTSLKTLYRVREMRRDAQVMVRTRDEAHLSQLMEAGATEVIPDTFEASMMLSSQVLLLMGHSPASILREVRKVRQSRYSLLQGFYPGESDEAPTIDKPTAILHSIILHSNAAAVGKSIKELLAVNSDITIEAIKRDGIRGDEPDANLILHAGDVVVIRGTRESVSHFEQSLMLGH